jgi:Flp pilus assembly protein TadB
VRSLRRSADVPVLITEARVSAEQEFSNRRRRYLIMMAGRAVCVVGAVVFYNVSVWLAAALLIGAAVLPWSAVLLANDGPAKQAVRFRRFLPTGESTHPELESGHTPPAPRHEPPETIDL